MANYLTWAEFGEGRYPDCHYEGREWPGSLRELVLEGFVDATQLRLLYPVRSTEPEESQTSVVSKTCAHCTNWMKTSEYEGICTSRDSLASTAETVEAQFTCDHWEQAS